MSFHADEKELREEIANGNADWIVAAYQSLEGEIMRDDEIIAALRAENEEFEIAVTELVNIGKEMLTSHYLSSHKKIEEICKKFRLALKRVKEEMR